MRERDWENGKWLELVPMTDEELPGLMYEHMESGEFGEAGQAAALFFTALFNGARRTIVKLKDGGFFAGKSEAERGDVEAQMRYLRNMGWLTYTWEPNTSPHVTWQGEYHITITEDGRRARHAFIDWWRRAHDIVSEQRERNRSNA